MEILKRKEGFTMVELLSAVVILGVLTVIGFASVNMLIDKSKQNQLEHQKSTLQMSAESYLQANRVELPVSIGQTNYITAKELKNMNYIKEDIYNGNGESCMKNSYVKVTKESSSKYTYEAVLCCGKKECPIPHADSKPVIKVNFTNKNGDTDKSKLTNNVSDVYIKIDIKGDETGSVAISSYSFSISSKLNDGGSNTSERAEVYSSGTLSANNSKHIEINKKLTEYIDITGKTDFIIEVNAINADGGSASATDADRELAYQDTIPPKCERLEVSPSIEEVPWINKYSTGVNGTPSRQIIAHCADGDGSGCIRENFTRSWPNTKQKSAEYAYIQVKDNAGNTNVPDSFLTNTDPCSVAVVNDACRVKVNVDTSSPSVSITSPKLKKTETASNSKQLTIQADGNFYNNLVNGWMNYANYPANKNNEIITYTVVVEDDIHIDRWVWKTSGGTKNEDSAKGNFKNLDNASSSSNCGLRNKASNNNKDISFTVSFKEEGKRIGKLTVYDKAGNHTDITIKANIDRTAPTISNQAITYNKWVSKTNSSLQKDQYKLNTWTNLSVAFRLNNGKITDKLSGFDHLHYELRNGDNGSGNAIESKDANRYDVKADGRNGQFNVRYQACDKAANCTSLSTTYGIKFDTTAPTCELNVSGTKAGNSDWYKSNVTVKFASHSDSGSGLDSYGLNNKNSAVYNKKASWKVEATNGTIIYGFVKDVVGNTGSCKIKDPDVIKIDKTKPTCELTISGTKGNGSWYKEKDATVKFKSKTDNESKVSKYFLSKTKKDANDVNFNNHTNTNSIKQGNTTGVKWYAYIMDNAGNKKRCDSISLKVDTTKPKAKSKYKAADWGADFGKKFGYTFTDTYSGLASIGSGSTLKYCHTDIYTPTCVKSHFDDVGCWKGHYKNAKLRSNLKKGSKQDLVYGAVSTQCSKGVRGKFKICDLAGNCLEKNEAYYW